MFQALGRYDEAFAIRREAASLLPSFETLGALAGLCAERGEIETAEQLFLESQSRDYRGVSPFPLAILNFQRGLMWMNNGRLDDAKIYFAAARRYVPQYAPAQGHLAEVEAQLGDTEFAINRLFPLARYSEDPDYAAQLSRILGEAGRSDEARVWSRLAGTIYDELVGRHPEAFADHAAEFWLDAGGDPTKALPVGEIEHCELRDSTRLPVTFPGSRGQQGGHRLTLPRDQRRPQSLIGASFGLARIADLIGFWNPTSKALSS